MRSSAEYSIDLSTEELLQGIPDQLPVQIANFVGRCTSDSRNFAEREIDKPEPARVASLGRGDSSSVATSVLPDAQAGALHATDTSIEIELTPEQIDALLNDPL